MDALAEEGQVAATAEAPVFDLGGSAADERFWAVNLDVMCRTTAATWCQSFGIDGERPVFRLTRRLLAGFAAAPHDEVAVSDIQDLLHRLAREGIVRWFAALGLDIAGRGFDRLRHSFLRANRNGDWSEVFLDRDVDRESLSAALTAANFTATPKAVYRAMPRQSL
jgi:hypothetical protein